MSRKPGLVIILAFILPFLVFASESPASGGNLPSEKKLEIRQNLLLGFGAGSRRAGNDELAEKLKTLDITGLSLTALGGIALAATDAFYDLAVECYGVLPKTDYYLSAAVLASGIGILIGSRIAGAVLPSRNIQASVYVTDDGLTLVAQVRL